jgi:hypothetical protein
MKTNQQGEKKMKTKPEKNNKMFKTFILGLE